MTIRSSRRGFLRGDFRSPDPNAMRPPGASSTFAELCENCTKCRDSCPESIIVQDADGRPIVDFALGACTFCGACAEACPTEALVPGQVKDWPWKPLIGTSCLSIQGVTCRACEDICDPRAIRFRPELGGKSRPILDFGQCTGCGACAFACPVQAVTFNRQEDSLREATE